MTIPTRGHNLRAHVPRLYEPPGDARTLRRAAVAAVIRNMDGLPELLLIERAHQPSDPWSGQIALPGGNQEPQDCDLVATARRECYEEVGLTLPAVDLLGRLDDQFGGAQQSLIISGCVFALTTEQRPRRSDEVADWFWVSFQALAAPHHRCVHPTAGREHPAVRLPHDRILWGLTYRFVMQLLAICGAGEAARGRDDDLVFTP